MVNSGDLYNPKLINNVCCAYYYRTSSSCRIVYFEFDGRWRRRLRQISFSAKEIDPISCVLTFKKIAKSFDEQIPYEPNKVYSNGIYTYYKGRYSGYVTVLDMNSAYLYALSQPLADWDTRQEVSTKQVWNKDFDFYCFENDLHCEMFYKEDISRMSVAILWADVKIYGYKASRHFVKTSQELYRLKCEVNKEKYKNVANIAVGCMHKRSGKQNNATLASSLYAWFAWHIDNLVVSFKKKGYNVIMVTTDSIKIAGKYNPEDNLVRIGTGLGEFKVEYEGEAKYHSQGHYEESKVKWKGKPRYMIDGWPKCDFIENVKEELPIYEKYTVK